MRFAAVQFDVAWEDKPANHALIEGLLERARLPAGSLVLLPELGDTGFSMNLDRIVDDRSLAWVRSLARRMECYIQHGYAERGPDGLGRNCAAIVSPAGEVLGIYRKVHPFSYGRESQHYAGGDRLVLRRCGEAMIAPMICYDLRFPELWRAAVIAGAEVFTIGASWPEARQPHWRALLIARAIENQAYIVAVNRIGRDPHLSYAGGSMIVSPRGEVLVEGGADESAVFFSDLDFGLLRRWRGEFPALRDIHRELLGSFPLDTTI
jgi:predicted amidohydrolase